MPLHPSLSIILIVHNQQEALEETLTRIYEQISIPFELVIIDDASTDESPSIITSIIEFQQHENTFYFEYDKPAGRGIRLNEALSQVSGSILWNPDVVPELKQGALERTVKRLHSGGQPFALMGDVTLPESEQEWIDYIMEGRWPSNDCFLWNFDVINPAQHYFQPRLNRFQGFELGMRAGQNTGYMEADYLYVDGTTRPYIMPDFSNRCELMFSYVQMAQTDENLKAFSNILSRSRKQVELADAPADSKALYNKAKRLFDLGDTISAFEAINLSLKKNPGDDPALELKVEILEKLRRYVEASELKHRIKTGRTKTEFNLEPESSEESVEEKQHEMTDDSKDANFTEKNDLNEQIQKDIESIKDRDPQLNTEDTDGPLISMVVPTALDGKPFLEQCLVSIGEECNPDYTELIIIDNASLDDTHDYLSQIKEENFFNCQVITNKNNKGFAASVNQGLEQARGEFICILHNDVVLKDRVVDRMAALLQQHENFGIIGPKTDNTFLPDQKIDKNINPDEELVETSYLDSFCMMVRASAGLRMDENFSPAYLEDIDFCMQASDEGYKVGVAVQTETRHLQGTTTGQTGLMADGEHYWNSARYFNEKWHIDAPWPDDEFDDPVLIMAATAEIINPYYPEPHLLNKLRKLYNDKIENRILKSEFDPQVLYGLIQIMMVMEERHTLRQLEDQLDGSRPPDYLIMRLIDFYFERNIYSRCRHYLEMLPEGSHRLDSWLYTLKIEMGERNLERATNLLSELMEEYPAHVELLHAASELHGIHGNEKEAEKFSNLAKQAAPFLYETDEEKSKNLS